MTSTFDAIRRVIADAEPMWRDTAVDKLARDIAAVVPTRSPDAPQPATTEVDREALALVAADAYRIAREEYDADEPTAWRQVATDVLAARGDAAAQTEVEWGSTDADGNIWPSREQNARIESARLRARLMSREVVPITAWREVEGGEQP